MGTLRKVHIVIWLAIFTIAATAFPSTDPSQATSLAAASPAAGPPASSGAGEPPQAEAVAPSAGSAPSSDKGTTAQGGDLKSWVQAHPRSVRDTVLGSALGAVGGCLLARFRGGNCVKGALVGAGAGAAAGFLIGRNQDKVSANRDEAVRAVGYQPAEGYVLQLEEVRAEPPSIAPGGQVTLHIHYLVISPNPLERITVSSFRGIKYQGTYLSGDGPSHFALVGGGIVTSSSTIALPREAPPGSYSVESIVEVPQRTQQVGVAPLYIVAANG